MEARATALGMTPREYWPWRAALREAYRQQLAFSRTTKTTLPMFCWRSPLFAAQFYQGS